MQGGPRGQGNVAVARAIAYFAILGHYVFLPIGDNGGAIDLIASPDGMNVRRVQCKWTGHLHTALLARDPQSRVWEVNLRQFKGRRQSSTILFYTADSFDLLFVSTPDGDYLIPWDKLCAERGNVPSTIQLGKKMSQYKLGQVNQPIAGSVGVLHQSFTRKLPALAGSH